MSFSMPSYLLGVGTVVGALIFGFGGGVLLTKTAIKDTASGPTRIERAARPEPTSAAPHVTEARAIPVPRAEPLPAIQPVTQVQAAEPVRQVELAKQAEAPKQAEGPKLLEQTQPEPRMSAREQRRAEREQRRMERRIERERYYAERRTRATEFARMRQRPAEERDQPARPELAFEREESKPNLFQGLFGRPHDAAAGESRE